MRFLKAAIVLLTIFLFAGIAYSAEINYGLKFATSFTSVSGELPFPIKLRSNRNLGFSVGPYMRISTNDRILSFQPELLLSYGRTDVSLNYPPYDINLETWYIELPLMVRGAFPMPTKGYFAPFIIGGPKVGLKLSDNVEGLGMDLGLFDIAVVLGLGADFGENSIEVRYSRDMMIDDDEVRKGVVKIFYSRNIW